ncbi:MAG: hypothetical protein IPP14_10180 [Planctomycetes bacterium]|nr:hypothetical protein [Planctomycetota bacterium]
MARFAPYLLVALAGLILSSLIPPPRRAQADASEIARDTGVRVLGATRGYASTALWLRAGEAYKRGDLYETTATYQLIRELQPRNPAVYSYLAWNEAYNLAAQFAEPERRMEWIARGFATLRQGQRALPADASLRLDEWHFVLNRSISFPLGVLETELPAWREADPQWAYLCEQARARFDKLSTQDKLALAWFLQEIGLQAGLFDTANLAAALSNDQRQKLLAPGFESLPPDQQGDLATLFNESERSQMRALYALGPEVHAFLALCHWCRFHLMTLVLEPAIRLPYRSLAVDLALMNSYRYAQLNLLPGTETEFTPRYKRGVATAFKAGIDNAARYGGESAKSEFASHLRENFEDLPGWLPNERPE